MEVFAIFSNAMVDFGICCHLLACPWILQNVSAKHKVLIPSFPSQLRNLLNFFFAFVWLFIPQTIRVIMVAIDELHDSRMNKL